MIRRACAWVLVVLATSPVTAPFCACDLHELIAYAARAHELAASPHVTMPEVRIDKGSGTASPRLSGREPATESRDGFVMLPFSSVSIALRDASRSQFISRPARRRPARPTVLRV